MLALVYAYFLHPSKFDVTQNEQKIINGQLVRLKKIFKTLKKKKPL